MTAKANEVTDWWKCWPSLYDAEMAAFAAHGATVTIANEQNGSLILAVEWPAGDRIVKLDVGYSPLHPFCRPAVTAPDLDVARHKNPFDGGLCLLVPDAGQWYPHQRVADLIHEQLPKIIYVNALRAENQWDAAAEIEEQAPDPLVNYFAHEAEPVSAVYLSRPAVPAQVCGVADFSISPRAADGTTSWFEAVFHRASPIVGPWLASPFSPTGWSGSWKRSEGRWIRLRQPLAKEPTALLAAAEEEIARQALVNKAYRRLQGRGNRDLRITAIVFEDEVAYGADKSGDGWLFLVERWRGKGDGKRSVALVRSFEISDDLFARLPVAAALRDKKILLCGVGAIGSFAALELVRAGIGELTIVDRDIVEPGNSVRWPLGRSAWGVPKVAALRDFIMRNYPSTRVDGLSGRLGAATTDVDTARSATPEPRSELRRLIAEADLVVDTSASTECQAALAHECRDIGRPLVIGYATEGVAGGIVVRLRSGAPACWICLNEYWSDGGVALPPSDPSATVVPVGCNSPTFTGGSFDLQEVSMEVARSAIGLLAPEAFDAGDWDWSSVALVQDGRRSLPRWEAGGIAVHPQCSGCGAV